MIDLAASSAASTADALREVAAELAARSDAQIIVTADKSAPELGPDERDEVVRIAREAMLNAIKHGRAKRITVELGSRQHGGTLLRVRDDGCGIPANSRPRRHGGFGLPAMRARAGSLGGQLRADRRDEGGTEVTVNLL
jgi:signal transduction histidine kinase